MNDDDRIIDLKAHRKAKGSGSPQPPLINLPPVTKIILGIMLAVQLALLVPGFPRMDLVSGLGFIPARYTVELMQGFWTWPALLSPITHMVVHGGWVHLLMNMAMLAAFGAGLEQHCGGRGLLTLTILGGLFGALGQMVVYPFSDTIMIGASGAISAQFAAILYVMQRSGRLPTSQYGIWPFAALWIGISVVFAAMNGFAQSQVAWAAHVGGFVGGLILIKLKKEWVNL